MLKMYEKITPSFYGNTNKFRETIMSEMIQIGILITLMKFQNMKNMLICAYVQI